MGVSRQQTAGLQRYSASSIADLKPALPAMPEADFSVPLTAPGTHLIAFASQTNTISLRADSFQADLHDVGPDFIKTQRELACTAQPPRPQRYRCCVKTLAPVPSPTNPGIDDPINMMAAKDVKNIDWDSMWGNLSFVMPARN